MYQCIHYFFSYRLVALILLILIYENFICRLDLPGCSYLHGDSSIRIKHSFFLEVSC